MLSLNLISLSFSRLAICRLLIGCQQRKETWSKYFSCRSGLRDAIGPQLRTLIGRFLCFPTQNVRPPSTRASRRSSEPRSPLEFTKKARNRIKLGPRESSDCLSLPIALSHANNNTIFDPLWALLWSCGKPLDALLTLMCSRVAE
jgi:hypothetical protein